MVDLISGEVEKGAVLWLGSFLKGWSNVNSEWSGVEWRGREGTCLSKSRSIDPFQRVEECRAEVGSRRSAREFLLNKQRQKDEGSGWYPSGSGIFR